MNLNRFLPLSLIGLLAFAVNAHATPVTVQELGIGANEIVTIKSSTLDSGNAVQVYAGVVKLKVNGVATDGFCIDPFHWSISGVQSYTLEPLADGPKAPTSTSTGGMGATTATKIEQLWQQYYSPTITNANAAGLQIAIWDLVDGALSGGTFQLVSTNDYGAANMLTWVNGHSTAPTAAVVAVTGPGQDYAIAGSVPDSGSTALLLGVGLLAIGFGVRESSRKAKSPSRC